jgi:acetylornithine deacetylase/succinyl-diaminopimelate desuccinylase-like protein
MREDALETILGRITDEQVLALEQAAIRIPSSTFEEERLADYLANYMSDAGPRSRCWTYRLCG